MTTNNISGLTELREQLAAVAASVRARRATVRQERQALLAERADITIGAGAAVQHLLDEDGVLAEEEAQLASILGEVFPAATEDENDDNVVTVPPPPEQAPNQTTPVVVVRNPRNWGIFAWLLAGTAGLLTLSFIVIPYSGGVAGFFLSPSGSPQLVTVWQWILGIALTLLGFYLGGWFGQWLEDEYIS